MQTHLVDDLPPESRIVHIIDDDASLSDALVFLFSSRGVKALQYFSAEAFLDKMSEARQGCVLLDVRMEGMSGFELFDHLRREDFALPVIFLTGHGDVPMAVEALKKGAHDFVEKPFNDNELVDRVLIAIARSQSMRASAARREEILALVNTLTERERAVMDLLLAGKMNKVIADDLGIAMRTVEVHRARIFEKTHVRSAVELANLLAELRR